MLTLVIIGILLILIGGFDGLSETCFEMGGVALKILGLALAAVIAVPLALACLGGCKYNAKPFGRLDLILGCAIGALMLVPIFSWIFLK
jgi:hypothetical protein